MIYNIYCYYKILRLCIAIVLLLLHNLLSFKYSQNESLQILKRTGFFLRISLNHLFFNVGCFFHGLVAAIQSLRGYIKQIMFGSSNFLRTTTFSEDVCQTFDFLKGSLFTSYFNCSHPSFGIVEFCQRKNGSHSFFEEYCIYYDGKIAVVHCLSIVFPLKL